MLPVFSQMTDAPLFSYSTCTNLDQEFCIKDNTPQKNEVSVVAKTNLDVVNARITVTSWDGKGERVFI